EATSPEPPPAGEPAPALAAPTEPKPAEAPEASTESSPPPLEKSADPTAEQPVDNTLSIPPTIASTPRLPQLPNWATQDQTILGKNIYITVNTDPHQNLGSCRDELDRRVWNKAIERVELDLGQQLPRGVGFERTLPADFLNQLIVERYLEQRETDSIGPVYIYHARVQFTPEHRQRMAEVGKQIVVEQRVTGVGFGVGAGLALLSLVYGGLKWRERRKPAQLLAKAAS
ncbi:MAG: hypothetical protein SFX18_07475, partial [Pirellulales bacterium]|nr:hypothetical protein [Pirellulales bacterium]